MGIECAERILPVRITWSMSVLTIYRRRKGLRNSLALVISRTLTDLIIRLDNSQKPIRKMLFSSCLVRESHFACVCRSNTNVNRLMIYRINVGRKLPIDHSMYEWINSTGSGKVTRTSSTSPTRSTDLWNMWTGHRTPLVGKSDSVLMQTE